jgi:hypothetical protein
MSIWTELLFLHGHVATTQALEVVEPRAANDLTIGDTRATDR